MGEQQRNRLAIWACVAMLLLCVAMLAYYLLPASHVNPGEMPDVWGMVLIDIADEDAYAFYHVEQSGVYVLAVDEDSQAYRAGMRSGDHVVSIGGVSISSVAQVTEMQQLSAYPLEITFSHSDDPQTVFAWTAYNDE